MSVRAQLLEWLAEQRDAFTWPEQLHYAGPADFVMREGSWHRPVGVLRGRPRHCFANAIAYAAARRWNYVEGYAMLPLSGTVGADGRKVVAAGDEIVHHAWVVDPLGAAYEVTWPAPGRCYRGIVFSVERADDCTWNGDASVIDDPNRGHPLLRQKWTGETPWTAELDADAKRRLELAAMLVTGGVL